MYQFPQEQFLQDLKGLLQIRSTAQDCGPVTPQAKLGQGQLDALEYMLSLGKKEGFRTKQLDGCAAWIEIGQGEEMLAIIAHVDTVPVGVGWTVEPFDLTVKDGCGYGRGVSDDKGPAMAAFYAMKALAQRGKPLRRRVRLILGADEELGDWACMKRYRETEELPAMAFTPDSEFPLTYAEKGILHLRFYKKLDAATPLLELTCKNAYNVVPVKATALWNGKTYQADGVGAHAMAPHKGVNAMLKLCEQLSAAGCDHPFVQLAKRATSHGLSIHFTDEPSGELTINPAIATVNDSIADMHCDSRVPVTFTAEQVRDAAQKAVDDLGFTAEIEYFKEPLYVPLDSELVSTLMSVYKDMTGDDTPARSSGGGTYARAFDNAVAFGAMLPGDPETFHQKDERWPLSSMAKATEIILEAITRLAT